VSQRGRPQKRKQRLFDSANRLLPFEKLRPIQRDETRLCWIVGEEKAKRAVRFMYVIQQSDIRTTSDILTLCKDDRANSVQIRQYLEGNAWNDLQSAIDSFGADDAVCGVCKRHSGYGRQETVKWLQCDRCLVWVHLKCVDLSRRPRGNWFCSACRS